MVDEQRAIWRLWPRADIPPKLFAVLATLFCWFMFVLIGDRAPDIRSTNKVRLDLFGQHTSNAGGCLFEFTETVHYELIVPGRRLVEPIDIGLVEPAFLAQMRLYLCAVRIKKNLIVRRIISKAKQFRFAARVKSTAAQTGDA